MRVLAGVVVALLLALCGAGQARQASPLRLVRTIPLENVQGRIDHMTARPDGRQLFVAALGSNMVVRIDTEPGRVTGSVKGISAPQGVFYIADSGKLAIASGGDGKVRVYDASLKLVGSVGSLEDADNVRYDRASNLLYVGYGHGALAVIDPDKTIEVAEIKLDGHPESFQVERKGKRIFVNVPSAAEIEVVDRETRAVVARWKLRDTMANFPMALDEDHHRLFVGCRKPARMLVFDTESGKIVARLNACGDTDDLFYDAARKRIYLSGGPGCASVFDQTGADTYELLQNVSTFPGARTSLFIPATGLFYVAVPRVGQTRARLLTFKAEARW